VASQVALAQTLNNQIEEMGAVVDAHCGRHPDAEIHATPGAGRSS
jgi:hypothetical protein